MPLSSLAALIGGTMQYLSDIDLATHFPLTSEWAPLSRRQGLRAPLLLASYYNMHTIYYVGSGFYLPL
jgi:hypothetical protein